MVSGEVAVHAGQASAGDRQQGQRAQSEGHAGSQCLQTECRRKGVRKGARDTGAAGTVSQEDSRSEAEPPAI